MDEIAETVDMLSSTEVVSKGMMAIMVGDENGGGKRTLRYPWAMVSKPERERTVFEQF